jgi:hypothetical protein
MEVQTSSVSSESQTVVIENAARLEQGLDEKLAGLRFLQTTATSDSLNPFGSFLKVQNKILFFFLPKIEHSYFSLFSFFLFNF